MKRFLIGIYLLLPSTLVFGQHQKLLFVDSLITQLLKTYEEIPSLSITVVKKETTLFKQTYGYADVEKQTKATTDTPYYIASTTKSFVGLLAAILAEEGVLDLDKPISEYAPIKHFSDRTLFEKVTIADLLAHTIGLSNNVLTWQFASGGNYSRKELNQILADKTSSLYNEQSFRYDNLGYNILDLILWEEFGIDWKKALQERIYNPLKMTHTSAYHSTLKQQGISYAQPYTAINDERLPTLANARKNDATFQAAGGMLASISDLEKWLSLQLNGHANFSKEALERAQMPIAKMRGREEPFKNNGYSLGWFHADFHGEKVIYHTGGYDGYFAMISFMPDQELGIAVLVNESHFGDNVGQLVTAYTYDLLLDKVNNIADYEKPLQQLKERVDRIQKGFARSRINRSTRKWQLSLPMDKYAGTYTNKYMGDLTIVVQAEQPKIQLGVTKNIGTPSASEDAIRVEFRDGRGQDLLFIYQEKEVHALVLGGMVFYRKN